MAALDGFVARAEPSRKRWVLCTVLANGAPPNVSHSVPWDAYVAGLLRFRDQPLDENPIQLNGEFVELFGERFWFNHLHAIPNVFSLGNLLSTQVRTYQLYNGYRTVAKQIYTITETGVEGFTITEPNRSPNVIRPKATVTVSVTISPIGPPTVSARVVYDFGSGETLVVTFTGARMIIMALEPQVPIHEELEWKTDIIESDGGPEQRIASRDVPRQRWIYDFLKDDDSMAFMENQIFNWAANVWANPVWTDYTEMTADISLGATSVPVTTTANRDFRAASDGTALALLFSSRDVCEVVQVSIVAGTTLTLSLGTLAAWPAGTLVVPMRTSRIAEPVTQQLWTDAYKTMRVAFSSVQNQEDRSISGFTIYKTFPVLEDNLVVFGGKYQGNYDIDQKLWDSVPARLTGKNLRRFPKFKQTGISLVANDRSEYLRIKRFLGYLRGKQKPFFMTTGRRDFGVRTTATSGATTIFVKTANFAIQVQQRDTRKYLAIKYANGLVDYRQILSSVNTVGVGEDLTLDVAVTQNVSVANIERISYLLLVRMDQDVFQFEHNYYDGFTTVEISVVDIVQ